MTSPLARTTPPRRDLRYPRQVCRPEAEDMEGRTFVLLPRGRPLGRFLRWASSACSPLAAPACPYAACCAAVCTWPTLVTGEAETQLQETNCCPAQRCVSICIHQTGTGLLHSCQAADKPGMTVQQTSKAAVGTGITDSYLHTFLACSAAAAALTCCLSRNSRLSSVQITSFSLASSSVCKYMPASLSSRSDKSSSSASEAGPARSARLLVCFTPPGSPCHSSSAVLTGAAR